MQFILYHIFFGGTEERGRGGMRYMLSYHAFVTSVSSFKSRFSGFKSLCAMLRV